MHMQFVNSFVLLRVQKSNIHC